MKTFRTLELAAALAHARSLTMPKPKTANANRKPPRPPKAPPAATPGGRRRPRPAGWEATVAAPLDRACVAPRDYPAAGAGPLFVPYAVDRFIGGAVKMPVTTEGA